MKRNVFLLIVILLLALISTFHFLKKDEGEIIYIAFIGPMSVKGDKAGQIMTDAIELYLDSDEAREQLKGKKVKLLKFDDKNDCEDKEGSQAKTEARRIVKENQVVAVIGHWWSSCSITGGEIYKQAGIPAITPGSVKKEVTEGNKWYFRNIYNASVSGQFLAYYVKNVFKLDNVTIIHDNSGYGSYLAEEFEKNARDLKMKVSNQWNFQPNDKDKEAKLRGFVEQLKQNSETAGAILLATQASEGIYLVKSIKDAGLKNPIISGSGFSEQTFVNGFNEANRGYYTNDIYVATPLIFDTANEKAQEFKENYQTKYYPEKPDWSAAYAYDTAMVLIEAIKLANIEGTQDSISSDRQKIRETLASFTNIHDAVEGTTGFNYFDENRDAQKPVAIGVYKNEKIVSALTQFQVLRNPNEIVDLKTARAEERVLSIGGKDMYKTKVVYTGVKINKISDFDANKLTFTIDFHLWFRFAGNYNPQDIEFLNAVSPDEIKAQLEKQVDEKPKGQIIYRVYRIKSRFRADFISSHYAYAYKQHLLGIHFHHKSLTRNNLIYVKDVLGMGETKDVLEQLRKNKVLSPASGWAIEQIKFFQDVAKKYSLGNPEYLNVQGGIVEYSQFNAGLQIKKSEFTLRGKIPYAYNMFVLSGIFILLINILSKKLRKFSQGIWFFQAILASILLLSAEVVLIDFSSEFEAYNMKLVIRIFDILWWLIPAFLLNLASELFIWTPLEEKSGRLIPNIVRLFLAFMIYFMAVVGIIAFVYEQALTSILATSGVIAMIIGLAIQINISNIFSGIAINIERPFRINDWVQIGNFEEGKIVDITWRTTRLKTRAECILSIPNSMASESPILNFCYPDDAYWLWPLVYVHPMHPPARVKKILLDALLSADQVLKEPAPIVFLKGINEWAAVYWIAFCADDYGKKYFILENVWERVWFHLNRAGITPAVHRQEIHLFKGVNERGGDEAAKPITLLQEVDIFKPFSQQAKRHLSERLRRHRFAPDDVIVQQGDAGDSLFIIVEGVVGIYVLADDGKSKEVARLGAGNFFGEMALMTGEDRTATVISVVDTYLFEITQADIAPLMAEQPEVSELVSKELTKRQLVTQQHLHTKHDTETDSKHTLSQQILNRMENFFGLNNHK